MHRAIQILIETFFKNQSKKYFPETWMIQHTQAAIFALFKMSYAVF
jgi:hypothetical protein